MNQQTPQELHSFPAPPGLQAPDILHLARAAQERVALYAGPLPLESYKALSQESNSILVKRADSLPGHCFKYLSAMNSVGQLVEGGGQRFAFATAGSYGIGVGHALQAYGGEATAFMPEGGSDTKRTAMEELGVTVVKQGVNFDESLEAARQHAEETSSHFLHPFAEPANLGGTGVIGLELVKECPEMTHLVLQYGGGSLVGGVASVVKQLRPDVEISAVQVAGCSPFVDSVRSGEVMEAADTSLRDGHTYFGKLGGVGVGKTDPMTLGVASQSVDKAVEISSDDVYAAMYDFEKSCGDLLEFAGAVGLAYGRLLALEQRVENANIITVATGANPNTYPDGYLAAKSRRVAQTLSRNRLTSV